MAARAHSEPLTARNTANETTNARTPISTPAASPSPRYFVTPKATPTASELINRSNRVMRTADCRWS